MAMPVPPVWSESTPLYGNVSRLGTACGHCAPSGFKVCEPAWIYLLERPAEVFGSRA